MKTTIALALATVGLTIASAASALALTTPVGQSKPAAARALPSFFQDGKLPKGIILARACNCPCPPEYCG